MTIKTDISSDFLACADLNIKHYEYTLNGDNPYNLDLTAVKKKLEDIKQETTYDLHLNLPDSFNYVRCSLDSLTIETGEIYFIFNTNSDFYEIKLNLDDDTDFIFYSFELPYYLRRAELEAKQLPIVSRFQEYVVWLVYVLEDYHPHDYFIKLLFDRSKVKHFAIS